MLIEPTFELTRDGEAVVLRAHRGTAVWFGLVFVAVAVIGMMGLFSNSPGFLFLLLFAGAGAFFAVPREFVTIFDPVGKRLVRSIVYFNGAFQQRVFYDFAQIESIGADEYATREGGFTYLPVLRTRSGQTPGSRR